MLSANYKQLPRYSRSDELYGNGRFSTVQCPKISIVAALILSVETLFRPKLNMTLAIISSIYFRNIGLTAQQFDAQIHGVFLTAGRVEGK